MKVRLKPCKDSETKRRGFRFNSMKVRLKRRTIRADGLCDVVSIP